jgi:hypothetical protein
MTSAAGWRSPLPCRHPSGNLVNVDVRLQTPANPFDTSRQAERVRLAADHADDTVQNGLEGYPLGDIRVP